MLKSASSGATLAYDPLLRLYQTTGSATTRLAYDGQKLIAEYNGSNGLLRRYVHGPGTDEPLVWYEGTGLTDRRFLRAEERGAIAAPAGGSSENICQFLRHCRRVGEAYNLTVGPGRLAGWESRARSSALGR